VAILIGSKQMSLAYPTKTLFDDVTVDVSAGDRIGVVGRNGDGKSTLLGLLAGRVTPDGGSVTRRSDVNVSMLGQQDRLDTDLTVRDAVVGDQPEYVWAADPQSRAVVGGLIGDLDWQAPLITLSGGQRRRVALASVLTTEQDCLFLDEPTNHLDLAGVSWLADHLKHRWRSGRGGLVLVTHDRWFLDEVCTGTWEVHDGRVDSYSGGYAAYVLQRVERDRLAAQAEAKRQNLMRKELAWLRRGAPARTSKPKFRIEAANQLIANEPPPRDTVALEQLATARLGKDVIDLLDVSVGFDGHEVLSHVEWRIGPGERTGILGANAAGKTTLLNLITGRLQPDSGRVKFGKTVRVATLSQQLAELAAVEQSRVRELLATKKASFTVGDRELTPNQMLERLGFPPTQLSTPIRDLSGGQRRRLQLLMVLLDEPNVLVLDEPTNDLDTDMLAAMEDLLDSWPGTLIVATHDRYLLERVTDQQYAIWDHRLRHLPGGVEEYLRLIDAAPSGQRPTNQQQSANQQQSTNQDRDRGTVASAPSGKPDAAQTRRTNKEIAAIERRLERVHVETDRLNQQMLADSDDHTKLSEHGKRLAQLRTEQDELEERWLTLSEDLDRV
jgi:ATPase subunit of ABC transporter with duplicated ATPase domains